MDSKKKQPYSPRDGQAKKPREKKPWYDAQAIRDDADPEAVINALGLESRRKGDSIQFLCPFHPDRHIGNCSISQKRKVYHCFSCGASGDIIGLAKKLTGLSYPETLAFVAESSGTDPGRYLQGGDEPEENRRRKAFSAENGKMLSALGLKATPGWGIRFAGFAPTEEEAEARRKDRLAAGKAADGTWELTGRERMPGIEELAEKEPEIYRWLLDNKRRELAGRVESYEDAVTAIVPDAATCAAMLIPAWERAKAAGAA